MNRVTPGTQPRGLVQGVVEESITSAKATIGRATISSADAPDGLARSGNETGTAPWMRPHGTCGRIPYSPYLFLFYKNSSNDISSLPFLLPCLIAPSSSNLWLLPLQCRCRCWRECRSGCGSCRDGGAGCAWVQMLQLVVVAGGGGRQQQQQ